MEPVVVQTTKVENGCTLGNIADSASFYPLLLLSAMCGMFEFHRHHTNHAFHKSGSMPQRSAVEVLLYSPLILG
jgi:hypothetical protein